MVRKPCSQYDINTPLWSGGTVIVRFYAKIKRIPAQPARFKSSALYTVQKGNAFAPELQAGIIENFWTLRPLAWVVGRSRYRAETKSLYV